MIVYQSVRQIIDHKFNKQLAGDVPRRVHCHIFWIYYYFDGEYNFVWTDITEQLKTIIAHRRSTIQLTGPIYGDLSLPHPVNPSPNLVSRKFQMQKLKLIFFLILTSPLPDLNMANTVNCRSNYPLSRKFLTKTSHFPKTLIGRHLELIEKSALR